MVSPGGPETSSSSRSMTLKKEGGWNQLIHGDLAGDILFAEGLDPGIIDFSPYVRPVGYAVAIMAVDAMAWHAAPPAIIDPLDDVAELGQMLRRALVFRLAAADRIGSADPGTATRPAMHHRPVIELVESRSWS